MKEKVDIILWNPPIEKKNETPEHPDGSGRHGGLPALFVYLPPSTREEWPTNFYSLVSNELGGRFVSLTLNFHTVQKSVW